MLNKRPHSIANIWNQNLPSGLIDEGGLPGKQTWPVLYYQQERSCWKFAQK